MAAGVKRTTIETKCCARCGTDFPRNRKFSNKQWAEVKHCSRHCGAWNLGLTKADDPRIAAYAEGVRVSAKGRPSWCKGLTKETHPSLAVVSRKNSENQKGKIINDAQRAGLALGHAWGKGRTKETCPVVAARGAHLSRLYTGRPNPAQSERLKKKYAARPDLHPNAIVARKTKGKGFTHIEQLVAQHLDALGVQYGYNVRIGSKWPDFSIHSHMLVVEADGEYWHNDKAKEQERDVYLNALGWHVLHLPGKLLVNEPAECRTLIENALEHCGGARLLSA